jgi:DAK2 domain fusion protein YloV
MDEVDQSTEERSREHLLERYRIIDAREMRRFVEAALTWLRTNQEVVNALNVFPVPDGDTGTNMVLTMQAAWDEIASMGERSIGKLSRAIAHGALMGARGNSGVILSQLWRGFARTLDDHSSMDAALFVHALKEARETAYKGVVRPVEGTILTVSSDVARAATEALNGGASSVIEVLERIVQAADDSVQRTPQLLPILKEAGVVDAGGLGLYYILDGMLRIAYGKSLDQTIATVQPLSKITMDHTRETIEPGQDWEVVIDFRPYERLDIHKFYQELESIGTSIQVGEGDGLYRLHIHVADAREYEPIEYTKTIGTVTNIAIENLMAQMDGKSLEQGFSQIRFSPVEPGQIAAIPVAPGVGIARVFASLGAANIVEGGQTMNPSTQDILDSIENLPTDKVILLPNNKNIILTARQAKELTVKEVRVVPTTCVPQGIAAMLALEPNGKLEDVVKAMQMAYEEIQTADITIATRSVEIDGVAVREGQIIGLVNGKLATAGDELDETLLNVLELCHANQAELITCYYGEDLSAIQANALADVVRKSYPNAEVELVEGNQPHYQIILSVE